MHLYKMAEGGREAHFVIHRKELGCLNDVFIKFYVDNVSNNRCY